MGYVTAYELTWEPQKGFQDIPNCPHKFTSPFCPECGTAKGIQALDGLIGDYIKNNEDISYALEEDGSTSESCKWYDHDQDMVAMSKAFPNVLFKLHGEGEEAGDLWDAYYLNGKMQKHKAKIMIDECDPKAWVTL